MRSRHARFRKIAFQALGAAALTLGCAQLLGLKEDEVSGACATNDQCAPDERCESGLCTPAAGSAGAENTGGSTSAGGKLNAGGSPGAGAGGNDGGSGNDSSAGSDNNSGASNEGGTDSSSGAPNTAGNGGVISAGGAIGGGGRVNSGGGGNSGGSSSECTTASDCAGTDLECAKRTCTLGKCGIDYVKSGVATSAQTARDCKKAICDGKGAVTSQADDTDLPDDGNVCTLDVCTNGVISHPFSSSTTSCGAALQYKCDGKGICGGCARDSDCGLNNLCASYACVSGVCQNSFVPSGQGNLANVAGDCRKNVCNGMGNPTAIADNADLPNDNNPCTKDLCNNGLPSNPFVSNTTSCGNLSTCDGSGRCVCSDPTACNGKCGTVTDGCGRQVNCSTCSAPQTCGGGGTPNVCGCTPHAPLCNFICAGTDSDGCGNQVPCPPLDCNSACGCSGSCTVGGYCQCDFPCS